MTRPNALRLLLSTALALTATATVHVAQAQSPLQPIGNAGQPSLTYSNAVQPFPNDVFRTTLAPFSRTDSLDPDLAPDSASTSSLKRWTLSLEAFTHAPVDVGAGLLFETPFGLRVGTGFGGIPSAYLDVVAGVAASASDYDSTTSHAVRNAVDGGTVWRSYIGVRPVGGLYLDGGYALVRLHGALSASDIASSVGVPLTGTGIESYGYDIHSTIHMWIAEIGWQTHLGRHVLFGLGAGVMGTISSSTEADPSFELGSTVQANALSESATDTVDELVTRYGFVPTVHARLGFDML